MKSYINEIKAFHDLIQIKSLSTGQIALWYALMYVNNKCAWTEWFTVANQMLESHSGLSRSGIAKARNVLRQHGIIDFKQQGSKATMYHLYNLSDGYRTQESIPSDSRVLNSAQVGVTLVSKLESEESQFGAKNRAPLNRLDKTIPDKTDNSCCCISRALENELAVPLSSTVVDMVSTWREEWVDEAVPLYAIEQAVLLNKRNVKYVDAMLTAWKKKGLSTLAAVKAEQADFAARKTQFKRGKPAPRNAHFSESKPRDLSKFVREE